MPRFRFEFAQMGCPCELLLDADEDTCAQTAARAAVAEVARLDRKYSHYRDDSLLAELEATATLGAVAVDPETAALLDFAAQLHAQTGGGFDITAGALVRLWDPRHHAVPSRDAIAAAHETVGWDRVEWTPPFLRLPAGARLDLGGIAKEYAADRAAQVCREHGVSHGLVVLGGDLAVVGPPADAHAWRVGIADPRDSR